MSFLAKAGKGALDLFLGLVALCLYIAMAFVAYYGMKLAGLDDEVYDGLYSFAAAVLTIICFLIYNRFSSSEKKKRLIKTRRITAFEVVLLVVIGLGLVGFVTSYLSVFILLSDYFAPVQQEVSNYEESMDRYAEVAKEVIPLWDSCLYAFTMAFLIPLSEEMVFRGAIYGHVERAFKPWAAIIITALTFGAMHGLTIHIGYAVICGIIITSCYYYTGSIVSSIILHSLFNLLGSSLPFVLLLDELAIPEDIANNIYSVVNYATLLAMIPAVFAFISLIRYNQKRMKAEAKALEETLVTEAAVADE